MSRIMQWGSKSELFENVSRESRLLTLGFDQSSLRKFYSIDFRSEFGVVLAVAANQDKQPSSYVFENKNIAIIYDARCDIIESSAVVLKKRISLNGLFYEAFLNFDSSSLIIIHELGVVIISDGGEVSFERHCRDIVEDWKVDDRCIWIFSDGSWDQYAMPCRTNQLDHASDNSSRQAAKSEAKPEPPESSP